MKNILTTLIICLTINSFGQTKLDSTSIISRLLNTSLDTNTFTTSRAWYKDTGYILHVSYKDTIQEYYQHLDLTLKSEYKADTIIMYNHYMYMKQEVEKEIEYLENQAEKEFNKYKKTGIAGHYKSHVDLYFKVRYWEGVRDGIMFVMYQSTFDYEFKHKIKN